ncbi:14414_t:CDS:2 [Funneliformis mosseae]|uniref:14414_t:CDS:1 n=1 Tax=Funneliformis mosseae TaxID=27381 RepID=A0A9N9DU62_FUNMO|nr:14414_t:CDS:2 [Funneliformis mosseae]
MLLFDEKEEQKEETFSERTLSSNEFNPNQLEDNKNEWIINLDKINSNESASNILKTNQASNSKTNISLGSSSMWLYFNKNPADDMLLFLEPLERTTRYLSASFYPTIGDIHLVFTGIQIHLDKYANDNNFIASEVAALISSKIKKYWLIMDT